MGLIAIPGTCRVCSCTEDNACVDEHTGEACAWADSTHTICTACGAVEDDPLADLLIDGGHHV